jgi:hypothetical protein
MEFGCETSLLAEMPAARQHFFLFSPIFYFLPVVSSPATLPDKAGEGASFNRTPERVSILFLKKFLTTNERCSAKPVPDAPIGAWGFLLLLAGGLHPPQAG